jgi:hypothetical protein
MVMAEHPGNPLSDAGDLPTALSGLRNKGYKAVIGAAPSWDCSFARVPEGSMRQRFFSGLTE